jgi:hypothetical protein
MAIFLNYRDSFPVDEQLTVEYAYAFSENPVLAFFSDLYNLTEEELKTSLLDQTLGDNNHLTSFAGHIFTNASAVTGGSDDEKWSNFKNSFSAGLQPSIQVIIDYYRIHKIPTLSFDDFVTEIGTGFMVDIIDSETKLYDFWLVYAKYLKDKAKPILDSWVAFENSLPEGIYRDVVKWFNYEIQVYGGDISDFRTFVAGSPSTNILDFIVEWANSTPDQQPNAGSFLPFLSKIIKETADTVINGFGSAEDKETIFYNSFRSEFRPGIKQLILEFIERGFISTFEELKDKTSRTFAHHPTITQVASPSLPQIVRFQVQHAEEPYEAFSPDEYNIFPEIGEKVVLKLNNTYLTHTFSSDDRFVNATELRDAINAATGDWSNITATIFSGTSIDLTYSTNNVPFIFTSESIFQEITNIIVENLTHPILLGLAEAYYADATAANTEVSETRQFKGRLVKEANGFNNVPLANFKVRVSDIDDELEPLVLGTTTSDQDGYFTISYTVKNQYIESKNLRIEVLDANDSVIKIASSKESNIFLDAANGTFEGGTAPDYNEFDLVLDTDIKIKEAEIFGPELQVNGDFSADSGGWYGASPTYTPRTGFTVMGNKFVASGAQTLTTGLILQAGEKYKIAFKYKHTDTILVKQQDGTTIVTVPSNGSWTDYEYTFVATGVRVYFQMIGPTAELDDVSIKNLVPESFEGDFSPEFYLDNTTFTSDIIFNGDTAITVEEDTDYEISAYVYFKSPIVIEEAVERAGIFLRPVASYTIYTLDDTTLTNGVKEIRRKEGTIFSVRDRAAGQWHKITSRFNSGANTSVEIAVAVDTSIASDTDYITEDPVFSFAIDKLQLKKAAAVSKDVTLVKTTGVQEVFEFTALGQEPTALEAATNQQAGASLAHIVNITPVNPGIGDVFIASLDGKYPISYTATAATVANVTAGLTAAIIAETAALTIAENQAPTSSLPQITYITPTNVLVGAKYRLKKSMKNLFVDGDNGTFEDSSNGAGDPPSDWGLTKGTSIAMSLNRTGSPANYRGTYGLYLDWHSVLPAGVKVLFSTNTAIKVKQNTKYKISAYVKEGGAASVLKNNGELYFVPKGYTKSQLVELTSFKPYANSSASAYKKIQSIFTTGSLTELSFNFVVDLKKPLVSDTGGYWYLDQICLEEVPDKTTFLEYTATGGTVGSVVTGLTNTIKAATANLAIAVTQKGDLTHQHTIRITPANVVIGAVYVLKINNTETITFTAFAATVANVTAGLVAAIQAETTGEWTSVTVTDSGTYVDITARTQNVRFSIKQIGGEWSDISVTDETTYVKVTGRDNDMPFTIEQVGSGWKTVSPSDEDEYVQVTANEDNEPFTILTKVKKASSGSATSVPTSTPIPAIMLDSALTTMGISLPTSLSDALARKEVYSLEDVVVLGGVKNTLDGELRIEDTQIAAENDPHIVRIKPLSVDKGDVYILKIDNYDTITYVSSEGTLEEVLTGLTAAINAATGDWANVTATNEGAYIDVTHISDNIIFTITQQKAADSPELRKLESLASLYTVARGLRLTNAKLFELLETLIEEGYPDALSIAGASQSTFVATMNKILGDFNAARIYELAAVRKNITQELAVEYISQQASYSNITIPAIASGEKLQATIGEQCFCGDCEAAVSPLAYLTDLINYVTKNLNYKVTKTTSALGQTFTTFKDTPFSLEKLTNTFYQNFIELPASCEDIKNTVCQPRVAIEILRRYLAVNIPDEDTKAKLVTDTRVFVFKAYKFLLESIGTSYSEVRIARKEEDKIRLAEKLGINYETNKEFLNKLFIEPRIVEMNSWTKFNSVMPGPPLLELLTKMQSEFTDNDFTFEEFVLADTAEVRTQLLDLPEEADSFYEILASLMKDEAQFVNTEVDLLNIPVELKEEQKWSKWLYNLSEKFSLEFREAFEIINIHRFKDDSEFTTIAELSALSVTDLAAMLTGDSFTKEQDFWTPFAAALKDKVEDFYLSEKDLEELFGLTDTRKDVFSDGAKFGDEANILQRWNIRGVKWGQNTDENGYIHLEMDEVDGVIRLFNNSERNDPADLVAVATLDELTNKFIIAEFEDSGLSGELIANALDADSEIYISAVPLYLSWRFKAMRERWEDTDRKDERPIIDPDLMGPADIKYPYGINILPTPADSSIDLWNNRKEDIEAKYTEIKNARQAAVLGQYTLHGEGELNNPADIAINSSGVVYIVDRANDRIRQMATNGTITNFETGLTDPKAIVVTPSDSVIVLDENEIKLLEEDGWSFGISGTGLGQFTNANDIALSSKGELYVTDEGAGLGRIQRFTLPYDYTHYTLSADLIINTITESAVGVKQVTQVTPIKVRVGDTFKLILGVSDVEYTATAATPDNVINGLIKAIALDGTWTSVTVADKDTYLEVTATTTNTPFTLSFDNKIALTSARQLKADLSGNVFITDKANGRVLKLDGDGKVVKVIGNPHLFTRGLIAMYRLDDGTGTAIRDSSGATVVHNGTLINVDPPEWSSLGKTGGSLKFDGTSNAITIATDSNLDSSDLSNRSVEVWFNVEDKDDDQYQVLYKQGDHEKGLNIYVYKGRVYAGLYNGTPKSFISGQIPAGTWHHALVVFEAEPSEGMDTFRLYLDGVLTGSNDQHVLIPASTSPDGINIGAMHQTKIRFHTGVVSSTPSTSGHYFKGALDTIRIWNRALDEEEVSQLYGRLEDNGGTLFIPGKITLDKAGNIYVADAGVGTVNKFDPEGNFLMKFGGYGNDNLLFKNIIGLEVDKDGNIYILDKMNNSLQKVNAQGALIYRRGEDSIPPTGFDAPSDLALDNAGFIYIADTGNNQIQILEPQAGNFIEAWTTYEADDTENMTAPLAISIDSNDNVIVVVDINTVVKIPKGNDSISQVLEGDGSPWAFTTTEGITLGSDGYVYLSLAGTTVRRFRFHQEITSVLVQNGITIAEPNFDTLWGIDVDPDNNLVVADVGNHRVLKLTPEGYYLLSIGKEGEASGTGEGEFNEPYGIATDESGNIYVADKNNNRMQKFSEEGEFILQWSNTFFGSELNAPVAVFIDKNRKGYIANSIDDTIVRWDTLHGIGALIKDQDLLGTSVAELLLLSAKERAGNNITEDLEALNIDLRAYRQLLKLIGFAESHLELLEEHLEDLYNILLQVYKTGLYADWKEEEAALGIILSQDFFVLRSKADERAFDLNEWRASKRNRKDWIQKLEARIDIEDTAWQGHKERIEEAEDELYIQLRDILVMATNFEGDTLLKKASDGSDKLLIDLKNNCCQRTTRISQAFETLQGVMWSIRTGLIQDTYPDWSISTIKFDEEWKWMGSYATWRAAQFVFMYPENILLPSYISQKSGPFNELVSSLRNSSLLTPKSAYKLSQKYIDDISELSNLTLSAVKQVRTKVSSFDAYYQTEDKEIQLVYLIGYSKKDRYFWATIDPATGRYYTDWQLVEGLEEEINLGFIGLETYCTRNGNRRLYLFLERAKDKTLIQTYYDLDKREWNKTVTDIDISYKYFTNINSSLVLNYKLNEAEPFHFVFSAFVINDNNVVSQYPYIHVVRLDDSVSKAEAAYDHQQKFQSDIPVYNIDRRIIHFDKTVTSTTTTTGTSTKTPNPAVNYNSPGTAGGKGYPTPVNTSSGTAVPTTTTTTTTTTSVASKTAMDDYVLSDVLEEIIGAVRLYSIPNAYTYYYVFAFRPGSGTYYKVITEGGTMLKPWTLFTTDKITYINSYVDGSRYNVLYFIFNIKSANVSESDKIFITSPLLNADYSITLGGPTVLFKPRRMNPILDGISYYNPLERNHKKLAETNKSFYLKNSVLDSSISYYVKEYQYLVPMYIAFLLNKRGYYKEALDWYRLVYDYSMKERKDRRIYYGLQVEDIKERIIDDFVSVKITTPVKSLINLQQIDNPLKNEVNQNARCTEAKVNSYRGTIRYSLPVNHTIDFGDPNFSLSILDLNKGVNGPTRVIISAKDFRNNVYATYTAVTNVGKLWEKLVFTTDFVATTFDQKLITDLYISFQLVNTPNSSLSNQIYYLADFMKGKQNVFEKPADWIANPIDPHAIASSREDSYTRYTLMAIAQTMLDYADSEYTQDTAESVPRARLLYEEALDLLNDEGIRSPYDDCVQDIEALSLEVENKLKDEPEWLPVWKKIKDDILHVEKQSDLDELLDDIHFILDEDSTSTEQKLALIRTEVNLLLDNPAFFNRVHNYLSGEQETGSDVYMALNADQGLRDFIDRQTDEIADKYLQAVSDITNVDASVLLSDTVFEDGTVLAQLRGTADAISSGIISPGQITGSVNDIDENYLGSFDAGDPTLFLMKDLKRSIADLVDYRVIYKPSTNFSFCIPSNPIVSVLRLKAELNLFKIRNCRNIAGVVREIDPFAAPTDAVTGIPSIGAGGNIILPGTAVLRPTIYRYQTLIERAKQLVQLAQQVEASMLATLEKLDAERYNMLKAKQDLSLSKAGIKLQNLRIKEAQNSIELAELQKDRAEFQFSHFDDLIAAGLNDYEASSLGLMQASLGVSTIITALAASVLLEEATLVGPSGKNGNVTERLQANFKYAADYLNAQSQYLSVLAGYERRAEEWTFQKDLANLDVKISDQQIQIANDHLSIVGQERQIAELQTEHAQATIDFLNNKFTNAELYDWMSGILESVYSFFLQQSTAIAKLAQTQLAFERQEAPSDFIKNDYWSAPVDNLLQSGSGEESSTDRKGLTGSARLLQDIFQLDQFAFNTDKRKLELTKTFSLATMFPAEFQRFKETGQLVFETNMRTLDRDFPGHYLRLIRKVSTSVIALIPPTEGIKATLSNLGVTYAVTGGMLFQKVPVVRSPESVALVSTTAATGLFEMNPLNTNDKLFPFENTGVEGRWIFSMPKASNFFDYSTIADILFTMEYTALHDDFYRMQVIEDLDVDIEADRAFSFRNQFPDQWYDLCNPELTDTPMKVNFTVSRADFPANIREMMISDLLMYFVKSDDMDPLDPYDIDNIELIDKLPVEALRYTPKGGKKSELPTSADATNAVISTKKNASNWEDHKLSGVEGTWELEFKQEFSGLFKNNKISDILFVISFKGEAPAWPK